MDDFPFKISDLEYSTSQKLLDEETIHECRHCSQDYENLILKLKQDIMES